MNSQTCSTNDNAKVRTRFMEKRLHWGLCYGVLDVERMACVIVQNGSDVRGRAMALLAEIEDGQIWKDEYTMQIEAKMRDWGIVG